MIFALVYWSLVWAAVILMLICEIFCVIWATWAAPAGPNAWAAVNYAWAVTNYCWRAVI